MHRAGTIRILASSGSKRSTAVPDVPTFTELGVKGVEADGWFGFFAPVGHAASRSCRSLNRRLNLRAARARRGRTSPSCAVDPAPTTPEQFGRILASDYAKWGPVVKQRPASPPNRALGRGGEGRTGFTID